jgi:hypothetical protein
MICRYSATSFNEIIFLFSRGCPLGTTAAINNCMLPIIPTDIFPRDLSEFFKKKYKIIKTSSILTVVYRQLLMYNQT